MVLGKYIKIESSCFFQAKFFNDLNETTQKISSVNVTKSAVSFGFGHIY